MAFESKPKPTPTPLYPKFTLRHLVFSCSHVMVVDGRVAGATANNLQGEDEDEKDEDEDEFETAGKRQCTCPFQDMLETRDR